MQGVENIQNLVKTECETLGHVKDWFYKHHLLEVATLALGLKRYYHSEANEEVVMLSVWLHDIGRIRGLEGEHAKSGADEARKILEEFGYNEDTIAQVHHCILTHSCKEGNLPTSIEGKILATADASSHFSEDFYLRVLATGTRTVEEFKLWALEKIERDYRDKLFFRIAKVTLKKNYEILRKFFTMN